MISPASVYLLACTWFVVTEEGPTPTFEDTAEEVVEVPDVETGVVEDTEVFDTEAPVFSAELSEVPTMATALELRWEAEGVDRVSASTSKTVPCARSTTSPRKAWCSPPSRAWCSSSSPSGARTS